ncbi:hypothetical protein Scep_023647 [Stephania cephalantha]|uniref:R13L1/DRL21-like LRR repeat region domain-containing protein n=1 Tax=Stephania cephalantha TaxID=152367 RepID=A0AAP0F0H9_9MAGN
MKSWFTIHPLFHDLAQFILGDVCVRCTASDTCVLSDKTRYFSFLPAPHEPIKLKELYATMSLRSLLILCQDGMDLAPIKQLPYDLFLMLRSLRVLCLANLPTSDLPDSIGTLKHLRFLDLSNTSITRLPESVSTLCNLQTLLLNDCRKLIELPTDFGNLINLRQIRMVGCDKLKKMPDGVGRLTNIQTCSDFFVGKTNGYRVSELGNLFQLRGELTIARLENVENNMDAMKANMKMKQYLHTLILKWNDTQRGNSRDAESEEQIVNFLQPHANLKILVILSYGGLRFPS